MIGDPVPVNGIGSYTLTTTPLAVGPHTITALYSGDGNFLTSTSSPVSELIYAFPNGPAGGTFVIGDLNSAVGTKVTFWGADWEKANAFSGGASPASFKGFANSTSTNPPKSGAIWTTGTGNSSGAPSSVPSYIGVIITSNVTKS